MPVAATFAHTDEEGRSLSQVARLDTMVTVVDAYNFFRQVVTTDSLAKRNQATKESM
jgi:G3E family GTPase